LSNHYFGFDISCAVKYAKKVKNTERFGDIVHEIGSNIRSSITDELFVPAPNIHHTCSPDLEEGFSGSKGTGLLSSGLP
jgi:hypothetical protein